MAERFAIVELMGHRRFGARISEADEFGRKFLRAEIPVGSAWVEQLINPDSVYALTTCDESAARAQNNDTWTLRQSVPGLPEHATENHPDRDCDHDDDGDPFEPIAGGMG